jgi:DNA polymerase-4
MTMTLIPLPFNPKPATTMHIDLNSCFASVEQLTDAHLRGKPVAVAAYDSPGGCIIAPSIEAKQLGIKVGMRVKDGRRLCRGLIVLQPDPEKYRSVHLRLKKMLSEYTDALSPKSIDEFVLNLEGYPALKLGMMAIAREIKNRIRAEIGESLTVSIGIAPNRFLAKTAASLRKPDGLDEINTGNHRALYAKMKLTDLCGIAERNALRLQQQGLYSVLDFYDADERRLRAAFQSILGFYWYARLRGWEMDDVDFGRKSYGNSFALPQPLSEPEELAPILTKLIEKTGQRMRKGNHACHGVHVALMYRDGTHWHRGASSQKALFDSRDIYRAAYTLLRAAPYKKPVAILAESVYDLRPAGATQLELFEDVNASRRLAETVDGINARYGNFVITPARMLGTGHLVPDRISFGGVKELEEAVMN